MGEVRALYHFLAPPACVFFHFSFFFHPPNLRFPAFNFFFLILPFFCRFALPLTLPARHWGFNQNSFCTFKRALPVLFVLALFFRCTPMHFVVRPSLFFCPFHCGVSIPVCYSQALISFLSLFLLTFVFRRVIYF